MRVLNAAFDGSLDAEEKGVVPLAGGIMQHGYQCGLIWGAALAAGARAYRLFGPGPYGEALAVLASQRLMEIFRRENGHVNCLDLTHISESSSALQMIHYFLVKGGTLRCLRMAKAFVQRSFTEVTDSLSRDLAGVPPAPLSCTGELARRLGFSDHEATMAAGLAGGIGLSGEGCGALGTAIWLIGVRGIREGKGKAEYKNKAALETLNRFMKRTGYEFECAVIAGRKFTDIGDHARYLAAGGCEQLLEVLREGVEAGNKNGPNRE